MKKALALVLALVLALSMAVSAFAADLITLNPADSASDKREEILVIDIDDEAKILYTRPFMPLWDEELTDSYVTYIALNPEHDYKDIKLSANGNVSAELVEFDPETMEATGALNLTYGVSYKGEEVGFFFDGALLKAYLKEAEDNEDLPDLIVVDLTEDLEAELAEAEEEFEGQVFGKWVPKKFFGIVYGFKWVPAEELDAATVVPAALVAIPATGLTYDEACAVEDFLDDYTRTASGFTVYEEVYANIIKLTVENNFTRAFTEGTIKIEATLNKKAVSNTLTVINDVSIFEYEMVKWAAENNAKGAALQLGEGGYSDYYTSEYGYGKEYDEEALREYPFALVVSTTAFRAIEGKDLTLSVLDTKAANISVTLKDIVAGQKGLNFFAWADIEVNERTKNDKYDDKLVAASFGFMSEDVVKGAFEINVELGIDYYELRELFGEKVEEEDIITYYVLKNGKEFDSFTVDYMTDDIDENVELTIKGENEKLGWYTLALEVPVVEEEVEENPNTGAEAVVGVVAALAVVSVATAAAVSLKK